MALFGKKKDAAAPVSKAEAAHSTPATVAIHDPASVIVKPRITEKAALLSENRVYTFEVRKGATKYEVRDAIKALYKVTPEKIRIVSKQPRHFMSRMRGRDTMEQGLRKAYVYLKEGDRIELV
jgi:large subunit ribosomal protein L23